MAEDKPKITNNEAKLINNAMLLRRELLTKLLNPGKDINFECGYPPSVSIAEYKAMYDREGLGTRVVRLLPEESWALDPEVVETEKSDETEFEKIWKELVEEKLIYHYLERIDILSGIGRFGVLLLGLSDGQDLSQPVMAGKELKLLYLKPFDESIVQVKTKEADTTNPRYGYPITYSIDFEGTGTGSTSQSKVVHWTRLIHVADNREISEVFGTPRMQPVYNRLLDSRKVVSGSGEMFWKGAFPGYVFEVNPERKTALSTAEKTSIREEFETYSQGLQRYLAISGVTAKSLEVQMADPKGHIDAQIRYISLTLGIPYRIFIGTEEAKLASTQDTKVWNKRLTKRRAKYISPMILKPFIDRLIEYKILPEAKYMINWPDLDAPSEKDQADITNIITEALSKYVQGDVASFIPPKEYLTMIMKMTEDEAEAIETASEIWEKENPPEEDIEPEPIEPEIDRE